MQISSVEQIASSLKGNLKLISVLDMSESSIILSLSSEKRGTSENEDIVCGVKDNMQKYLCTQWNNSNPKCQVIIDRLKSKLQLTLFAVLFGVVMSRLMRAYRDGDDKNENHQHEDGREKNGDQIDSTLMHKVQQ